MKHLQSSPTKLILVVVLSFLIIAGSTTSNTIAQTLIVTTFYVKPNTAGDCSSWENACDLQIALSAVTPSGEIWAAAGTYHPHATDRTKSFTPISNIRIYGGFPASGGELIDRDWEANPTYLSGDIGTAGISSDNSYHVLYFSDITNSILDGFIITDGFANGTNETESDGAGIYLFNSNPIFRDIKIQNNTGENGAGGGIFALQSNPTLDNVTFIGNTSNSGGGMYNEEGSPTLTNVTFADNTALFWGGGLHTEYGGTPTLTDVTFTDNSVTGLPPNSTMCQGGGMSIAWGNAPVLTNVTFSNNTSEYIGGGLSNQYNGSVTMTNVTFTDNTAYKRGGGMYNNTSGTANLTNVEFTGNTAEEMYGGGLYNTGSGSTVLNHVSFTANTANQTGGGMDNSASASLTDVVFRENVAVTGKGGGFYTQTSSPSLTDISFINNSAGEQGGGVHNSGGNPTYTNVTFSGNIAQKGGGMSNHVGSHPTLTNVTFSDNEAAEGGAIYNWHTIVLQLKNVTIIQNTATNSGSAIYNFQDTCSTTMINSILWGNISPGAQIYSDSGSITTITYSDIEGSWAGEGNIDADPKLLPLAYNGGLTQTHALGLRSPGIDSGSPTTCPPTDQRGMIRPFDADGDGTAICDMGSYEVQFIIRSIFLPLILK